jgi:hypothetical protein
MVAGQMALFRENGFQNPKTGVGLWLRYTGTPPFAGRLSFGIVCVQRNGIRN